MNSLPEQSIEKTSEYLGVRYRIRRSMRRTIQLTIGEDGTLLIKMPLLSSEREARELIGKHLRWISARQKHTEQLAEYKETVPKLSEEEMKRLKAEAKKRFPERTAYYAQLLGVEYHKISYRFQRTRWGSCTRGGNLNFNCLLLLAPEDVLDSVVVHELCHRKEMNHSADFYREINRVFPGYKKSHAWLKMHGDKLISRLP